LFWLLNRGGGKQLVCRLSAPQGSRPSRVRPPCGRRKLHRHQQFPPRVRRTADRGYRAL